jgi:tripartite ATP-independent transporter DctM subunit
MRIAKWALLFPVILIVGIRSGVFTPSEAGAFAVVYALVVGAFFHRDLTWPGLKQAIDEAVSDIGMIMAIIMFSALVGYAIIYEQAPHSIAQAMGTIATTPLLLLALILIFLLLIGTVIESTVSVLLLTPILAPIIRDAGIDPVHFGILMMTIVTLGAMTPPVGVAMYAVCGILDCTTEEYVRESWPFFVAIFLLIVVLMLFPGLVLFVPNLLM